MTATPKSAAPCPCISNVNNLLREYNTALVTTMLATPERCSVSTNKVDAKKRGQPQRMIASYCPFCGSKYAKSVSMFQTPGQTPGGDQ